MTLPLSPETAALKKVSERFIYSAEFNLKRNIGHSQFVRVALKNKMFEGNNDKAQTACFLKSNGLYYT